LKDKYQDKVEQVKKEYIGGMKRILEITDSNEKTLIDVVRKEEEKKNNFRQQRDDLRQQNDDLRRQLAQERSQKDDLNARLSREIQEGIKNKRSLRDTIDNFNREQRLRKEKEVKLEEVESKLKEKGCLIF